jgi:phosphoribosylglycinamide formyltransferase-1
MLNIAVLVSGGGTNLQALLDAQAKGALRSGRISLVVSNKPDAYALERAKSAGVEAVVLERRCPAVAEAPESPEAYGRRLLGLLREKNIHMVVLAGFMVILDACVIEAYRDRILNVHPSLIPAFCGAGFCGLRVHEAALQKGVKVTGATVHLVNEIPDGGRILAQKAVDVLEGDTPEMLQKRVMVEAEWRLLPEETEKLAFGLLQSGRHYAKD